MRLVARVAKIRKEVCAYKKLCTYKKKVRLILITLVYGTVELRACTAVELPAERQQ